MVSGDSDLGFNSYQRYKDGTKRFSQWLAGVAKRCGESIGASSTKIKTKEGKDEYPIPIGRFVDLAVAVTNSTRPKISVPRPIYNLLSEVIELRKEKSKVLGRSVKHSHDNQNDGLDTHIYFIRVLEQVKEILSASLDQSSVQKAKLSSDHVQNLANIFKVLDVEEPIDGSGSTSVTPSGQSRPKTSSKVAYDIEETHDDVLVASLFFFHDLNDIRALLRELWSDYHQGRASLTTASLVTNTAIELIQRNVKKHLAMLATWRHHHAPVEDEWIMWVYDHICSGLGMDFQHRERVTDDINFATYDQADYVSLPASCYVAEVMNVLETNRLMITKGHDTRLGYSDSPREKWKEDHMLINFLISDLHNAASVGVLCPPGTDSITRSFLKDRVSETKKVPVWLILAFQIVLDIHHVLRQDSLNAFTELQATGERVTETIRSYFRFSRTIEKDDFFHKENDPEILRKINFISTWINKDPINTLIRKYAKIDPEKSGYALVPYFLMKNHPLLCGSIIYWLNIDLQQMSIMLSSTYDFILSAIHLYNAAKQSKFLMTEWPDLEYLISVHTEERLFIGGRPTEPGDYFKRFQIAQGASAINFSQNRRAARPKKSLKNRKNRNLQTSKPIHDVFRARYCQAEDYADLTDAKVDAVIAEVVLRHPGMGDIAVSAHSWSTDRKLTSLQLLSVLRVALGDEDLHTHFDYISMNIRCANLFTSMRDKFIKDAIDITRQLGSIEDANPQLRRIHQSEFDAAKYVEETMSPDDPYFAIALTSAVFMADPAAVPAAMSMASDCLWRSKILQYTNVSLERAGEWMREVAEKEGEVELSKARALCRSESTD